jgi:hypothetical protein
MFFEILSACHGEHEREWIQLYNLTKTQEFTDRVTSKINDSTIDLYGRKVLINLNYSSGGTLKSMRYNLL